MYLNSMMLQDPIAAASWGPQPGVQQTPMQNYQIPTDQAAEEQASADQIRAFMGGGKKGAQAPAAQPKNPFGLQPGEFGDLTSSYLASQAQPPQPRVVNTPPVNFQIPRESSPLGPLEFNKIEYNLPRERFNAGSPQPAGAPQPASPYTGGRLVSLSSPTATMQPWMFDQSGRITDMGADQFVKQSVKNMGLIRRQQETGFAGVPTVDELASKLGGHNFGFGVNPAILSQAAAQQKEMLAGAQKGTELETSRTKIMGELGLAQQKLAYEQDPKRLLEMLYTQKATNPAMAGMDVNETMEDFFKSQNKYFPSRAPGGQVTSNVPLEDAAEQANQNNATPNATGFSGRGDKGDPKAAYTKKIEQALDALVPQKDSKPNYGATNVGELLNKFNAQRGDKWKFVLDNFPAIESYMRTKFGNDAYETYGKGLNDYGQMAKGAYGTDVLLPGAGISALASSALSPLGRFLPAAPAAATGVMKYIPKGATLMNALGVAENAAGVIGAVPRLGTAIRQRVSGFNDSEMGSQSLHDIIEYRKKQAQQGQ